MKNCFMSSLPVSSSIIVSDSLCVLHHGLLQLCVHSLYVETLNLQCKTAISRNYCVKEHVLFFFYVFSPSRVPFLGVFVTVYCFHQLGTRLICCVSVSGRKNAFSLSLFFFFLTIILDLVNIIYTVVANLGILQYFRNIK